MINYNVLTYFLFKIKILSSCFSLNFDFNSINLKKKIKKLNLKKYNIYLILFSCILVNLIFI